MFTEENRVVNKKINRLILNWFKKKRVKSKTGLLCK